MSPLHSIINLPHTHTLPSQLLPVSTPSFATPTDRHTVSLTSSSECSLCLYTLSFIFSFAVPFYPFSLSPSRCTPYIHPALHARTRGIPHLPHSLLPTLSSLLFCLTASSSSSLPALNTFPTPCYSLTKADWNSLYNIRILHSRCNLFCFLTSLLPFILIFASWGVSCIKVTYVMV